MAGTTIEERIRELAVKENGPVRIILVGGTEITGTVEVPDRDGFFQMFASDGSVSWAVRTDHVAAIGYSA